MTTSLLGTETHADRFTVERELHLLLTPPMSADSGPVCDAMRYAVLGNAQRFRPLLAMRVARMLDCEHPLSVRAAAAVELLHCASLIVDDLPCMDNADWRRGRPAAHIAFGEATAVLAAHGLVALAARSLVDCDDGDLPRMAGFQRRMLRALDCSGLIAGQALDLALNGHARDEHRERMNELKTVPLFRLAVEAGALYADLSPGDAAALDRFGREFGLAFQMVDDCLDGEGRGWRAVSAQIGKAQLLLAQFGDRSHELNELLETLHARVAEKHSSHR